MSYIIGGYISPIPAYIYIVFFYILYLSNIKKKSKRKVKGIFLYRNIPFYL